MGLTVSNLWHTKEVVRICQALCCLPFIISLNFTTTPGSRSRYYYLHFINEETKVERVYITSHGPIANY